MNKKSYRPKKIDFILNAKNLSIWYGTEIPNDTESIHRYFERYTKLFAKEIRKKFPGVRVYGNCEYNNDFGDSIKVFVEGKDSYENERIEECVYELQQNFFAAGNFF